MKWIIATTAAIAFLFSTAALQAEFTELIVFGDSMSDVGNDLAVFGGPVAPYYAGRFSDGPLWIDQFATGLGLPLTTASEGGGTNYAYGGAESGHDTNVFDPGIKNVGIQIDDYIASSATPTASQLFVVFAGHNNFRGGVTDPAIPVAEMVDHVTELAGLGAGSFLVPNLMPLGQLPESVGTGNEAPLDALSAAFNSLLSSELDTLRTTLGVTIYEFDTWSVMQDMIGDPGAYGFTNVTDPAWVGDYAGSGVLNPNPEDYLFWDEVHPSTIAQSQLAAAALAAVPEPSTFVLAGLGLATLAAWGWRRKR